METFDIIGNFRQAIAESDSPDPIDAIVEVVHAIPPSLTPEAYRRIIADCLRALAVTINGQVRRRPVPVTTPQAVGAPRKAAAFAELKLLRESYPTDDGYRYLGDMTPDQVDAAAHRNEELARANEAAAKRLRCIADVARRNGAAVIRDVPADQLQEFER